MNITYRNTISRLIAESPFDIDIGYEIRGRVPTLASSAFLTNKQQGDWAEEIVCNAINEHSPDFYAVRYGRNESLDAGDPGFPEFYAEYQDELNTIGKKPDVLIFNRADISNNRTLDLDDDESIQSAIAAIEVRSSSFLATRYANFMDNRTRSAEIECMRLRGIILGEPYGAILQQRRLPLYQMIADASVDTFRELDFVARGWYSSPVLTELSGYLKDLKGQIKILHTRDYLSITPKIEDIVTVNRWIQNYGVPHYYLQVFFDKAYIMPFADILELTSDTDKEGEVFSIERNVKNQGKTTINVDIRIARELIGRIDMPEHRSVRKEQERGRLLFYVTFSGGKGYLDPAVLAETLTNHAT